MIVVEIKYKGQSLGIGGGSAAMAVSVHNVDGEAHNDIRALCAELRARAESLETSLTGLPKLAGKTNPTAQTEAQEGQVYLNTATGQEFVCAAVTEEGTVWEEQAAATVKMDIFAAGPQPPEDDKLLWIDTNASTGGLKYWNGTGWVYVPVAYT